jgi:hypothetical protein
LQTETPDIAGARQALEVVIRAAMDGADTVKRLLLFGRPSQDGPAESLDVGELLREVATLTAPAGATPPSSRAGRSRCWSR